MFEKQASGGVDNPTFTAPHGDAVESSSRIPPKPTSSTIDTRFGYGPFKPRCLQVFNKMWVLTLLLTIFCFLEGFAVNGVSNAGLPAIERQFRLTSQKSSLIPAAQDIGSLLVILIISFIGGRYNKIRWIAVGSLIMALGSVIFIIPHMVESYSYEGSAGSSGPTDQCGGIGPQGGPPPCESEGERWVGVLMLAQIVHGIGFTPMFTLGTVYLDDNSNPATAAVYVGICYAATAVGVACGFFAGGQIMENFFVEFDRVDTDTLGFDAMDSRWVGAWWLGFVFTSILFAVVAIPLLGYPKYMPGNAKLATEEASDSEDGDHSCCEMVIGTVKDFFRACLALAKNPTFIFVSLGGCAVALIMFGVSAFSFKFLLEMYNMSFGDAGLLLGGLILVGSVGMFLGGAIIRVFKLEIVGMLRLNVGALVLACVLGTAYLATCPELNMAGKEVIYPGETTISGYDAGCNAGCGCDKMPFQPVCGDDGIVYYSACHAGCLGAPAGPMMPYTNCSCVASGMNVTSSSDVKAFLGRCHDGCDNLKILAPCLFIMMIAVLTATTPGSMATLRCVDEDIRPFALGVGWVLLRLLGSIPGPVLIGTVIDSACQLWTGGVCGGPGACLLYSKDELSMGVLVWWVVVTALAALIFFIASVLASILIVKGAKYDVNKDAQTNA